MLITLKLYNNINHNVINQEQSIIIDTNILDSSIATSISVKTSKQAKH